VCVQEFSGNVNQDKESRQFLRSPIVARYVRIHPVEWHRQIGLRAGLFGCPHSGTYYVYVTEHRHLTTLCAMRQAKQRRRSSRLKKTP